MIVQTNISNPHNVDTRTYRLAVVLTVFNRREKTLECLRRVMGQTALEERIQCEIFLLDDGSKDGTADAIRKEFPEVHLMEGDGNHFWNGGMNVAFGAALKGDFDFYLWLNDDTFLYPDAIDNLLNSWEKRREIGHANSIIIGGTLDPESGKFSYGGFKRASKWTLKLLHVEPGTELKECATMCGNCVLIPRAVSDVVGNIEPFYKHRWGDPDYGLRTSKLGGSVWITPGYVGECEANPLAEAWTDNTLSIKDRIKDFHSIKGYRRDDWFFYVRRHGGPLWLLLWMKPYVDIFVSSLQYKLTGKAKRRL